MTTLFLHFPKDTDLYVQRSGSSTGATNGNYNIKKVVALRELSQLKTLEFLQKSQYCTCFLIIPRSPTHGLIPYCIRNQTHTQQKNLCLNL